MYTINESITLNRSIRRNAICAASHDSCAMTVVFSVFAFAQTYALKRLHSPYHSTTRVAYIKFKYNFLVFLLFVVWLKKKQI